MMTIMPSSFAAPDRVLLVGATVHAALALVCACLLFAVEATPILGEHPAQKPLRFGLSIAIFLGTLAWIVPSLDLPAPWQRVLAALLAGSMLVESIPIAVQAARGTRSHFHTSTPFDAAMWQVMVVAAVVATLTFDPTALVATARPLLGARGDALDPLLALAVRVGLWLLPVGAAIGFAMGGRLSHTIGGGDGGASLPVTGWSSTHGDLRVAHFVALHGLQLLPLVALAARALPLPEAGRWTLLVLAITAHLGVLGATWAQALRGQPLVSIAHPSANGRAAPEVRASRGDGAVEELGGELGPGLAVLSAFDEEARAHAGLDEPERERRDAARVPDVAQLPAGDPVLDEAADGSADRVAGLCVAAAAQGLRAGGERPEEVLAARREPVERPHHREQARAVGADVDLRA
jgi:hypothetical protein